MFTADKPVTRSAFLEQAVKAFGIPAPETTVSLPYRRVPQNLSDTLQRAQSRGALAVFGSNLDAGKNITLGEAVQVLAALGQFPPTHTGVLFRDVPAANTNLVRAVAIALEKSWVTPQSKLLFGTKNQLKGTEAELLIRKASGLAVPVVVPAKSGETPTSQTIRITLGTKGQSSSSLPKEALLQTLWKLIQDEYLYEDNINSDAAAYAAAAAMMQSLGDPYSIFMKPVDSREFQSQFDGSVTGIGAQVEYVDGFLTIVTPLPGSPAEKAGLQPSDQILSADGVSIVNIGFYDAVEKIRGPKGTSVKLRIRRSGSEFDVTVERAAVVVPEVDISWQGKVAVVKILQFGTTTDTKLRGVMMKIEEQKPQGIILDLRNNPGGLLHAADQVVSNFVPLGTTVAQIRSKNSLRNETTDQQPTVDAATPLVVLVNGGSASASEIVAGALQDTKRATLVGQKTFGKGTVQEVLQFNDQSAIKMTVAEWLTPNGRHINKLGIEPDIAVEDAAAQLSKALELIINPAPAARTR